MCTRARHATRYAAWFTAGAGLHLLAELVTWLVLGRSPLYPRR